MNTNETNTNKVNFSNEELKNTPFRIVGDEEKGYILTFGKYRITEPQKTKSELIKLLDTQQWQIITTLIIAINHASQEYTTTIQQ